MKACASGRVEKDKAALSGLLPALLTPCWDEYTYNGRVESHLHSDRVCSGWREVCQNSLGSCRAYSIAYVRNR